MCSRQILSMVTIIIHSAGFAVLSGLPCQFNQRPRCDKSIPFPVSVAGRRSVMFPCTSQLFCLLSFTMLLFREVRQPMYNALLANRFERVSKGDSVIGRDIARWYFFTKLHSRKFPDRLVVLGGFRTDCKSRYTLLTSISKYPNSFLQT